MKPSGQINVVKRPKSVVLYGSSGHALGLRDAFCTGSLSFTGSAQFEVLAYIDDFRGGQGFSVEGTPIITLENWRKQFPNVPCAIAIGDPGVRRSIASKVKNAGGVFCSLYEIGGWVSPTITVGEGSLICPSPTYVGPRTKIGDHVMIMPFGTVGHDCVIGNYVTICPSANVSGHVIIEDGAFIGVGATIANGSAHKPLRIGGDAIICAGAVVLKSIRAGATVAGNPAEDLRSLLRRQTARQKRES